MEIPGPSERRLLRLGSAAFRRANVALFFAGFATFAALYAVQPLLPTLSSTFGVSPAQASLALSVSTLALAIGLLVAGSVSETLGRKGPIVGSLVLTGLLGCACAVAPTFGWLLVLRGLEGLALSGLPAIMMAYVGEEMDPRSLGLAMGLYVGGTALGGMTGRLAVGAACDLFGWRGALAAIGVLGLASAALVAALLPASANFTARPFSARATRDAFVRQSRDVGMAWLYAEGFLLMGAFVTVYDYLGYRLAGAPYLLTQTQIGRVFAVYLLGVVASTMMGGLADRFGRGRLLPIGFVLMTIGLGLTCLAPFPIMISGIALFTFGFFASHSLASSWIGRRTTVDRAYASALYLFAYYVGSSVVSSLGGIVYADAGWNGVALGVFCVLVLGLVVAAGPLRTLRPLAARAATGG